MSDESRSKKPSHTAYQVREAEEDRSYFNKVGTAWEHRDGKGYNSFAGKILSRGMADGWLDSPSSNTLSQRSNFQFEY